MWKCEIGIMGSIEDKMARLSPEQRREVENFIDFILQKNTAPIKASPGDLVQDSQSGKQVNPVILAEEKPLSGKTVVTDPLPVFEDRAVSEGSGPKRELQNRSGRQKGKDPGLLLDWIE